MLNWPDSVGKTYVHELSLIESISFLNINDESIDSSFSLLRFRSKIEIKFDTNQRLK